MAGIATYCRWSIGNETTQVLLFIEGWTTILLSVRNMCFYKKKESVNHFVAKPLTFAEYLWQPWLSLMGIYTVHMKVQ